jgi:hypothetical protein
MIRDSQCWDRRTLKRGALHRKKLRPKDSHFTGQKAWSKQYPEKFRAEMTHIWPGNTRPEFGVAGSAGVELLRGQFGFVAASFGPEAPPPSRRLEAFRSQIPTT